jgi:hypothetical protein
MFGLPKDVGAVVYAIEVVDGLARHCRPNHGRRRRQADHRGKRPAPGGRGPPGVSSAGQENVLDVRVRPKPGAEQLIIRFPEPSGHFPAHVHLDQRELLGILLVDLVEVGC